MQHNQHKHLTLDERRIILKGIENESTKTAIASTLRKDKSAIGKEISLPRFLKYKSPLPSQCPQYKHCIHNRICKKDYRDFLPFICQRHDRSPGACSGCKKINSCRFDKFYYSLETAEIEYREALVDSRLGVNLMMNEAKALGNSINLLLQQGQSPYTIIINHPELGICEKTLYNYIDTGVFECVGIHNMDLRKKSSRKISKKQSVHYKKREDKQYLEGRTYKDYIEYKRCHPDCSVVEMDTHYNDVTKGPFIQTFKFLDYGLLLGIFHTVRNNESMLQGIDVLQKVLGTQLFYQRVKVLLTDRGASSVMPKDLKW